MMPDFLIFEMMWSRSKNPIFKTSPGSYMLDSEETDSI